MVMICASQNNCELLHLLSEWKKQNRRIERDQAVSKRASQRQQFDTVPSGILYDFSMERHVRCLHLVLEIERDVAKLFLDVPRDLALRRRGQRVSPLGHNLHHVLGEVAPGQVQAEYGVRQGEALVDRDRVRDAIAGVEHDSRGLARRVQGEDRLDCNVHGRGVKGLKHDLDNFLAVGFGVERGFCE